ncbi:MAG: hypothetical protein LBN94_02305 [Puniceicoccales bacterium]|jgi:hypothetical protein|nr:hypothetical protein [Puniceicoccales bacterium]
MKRNIYILGILCLWCFCLGDVADFLGTPVEDANTPSEALVVPSKVTETVSSKEKAPQSCNINQTPVLTIKATKFQQIFNNQPLLEALGLDNNIVNIFLLSALPAIGKDCSALKEDTNVALFFFEDEEKKDVISMPYLVFQVKENDQEVKAYLKREKIAFLKHEGHLILSDSIGLEYLGREKDFLKKLIAWTKEPLEGDLIEIELSQPMLQRFTEGLPMKGKTLGISLPAHLQALKIGFQLNQSGMNIAFKNIYDKNFPNYDLLKTENYKERFDVVGEYVDSKDIFFVTGMQNLGNYWDLSSNSKEEVISLLSQMDPKLGEVATELCPSLDKFSDSIRAFLPRVSLITGQWDSLQQGNIIFFLSGLVSATSMEQFLDTLRSALLTFGRDFKALAAKTTQNIRSKSETKSEKEGTKSKEKETKSDGGTGAKKLGEENFFQCEHHFLEEHKGYRIHAFTVSVDVEREKSVLSPKEATDTANANKVETTTPVPSEKKSITCYCLLDKGRLCCSNSLDHLKGFIESVAAKKLPAVAIESFLGGFPEGTLAKVKIDLANFLSNKSGLISTLIKEMPVDIKGEVEMFIHDLFPTGMEGAMEFSLSVKNDRIQWDCFIDYKTVGSIASLFRNIAKRESEKESSKKMLESKAPNKIYKSTVPLKSVEKKSSISSPLVHISRWRSFPFANERQILIPVKIWTKYKAFC